MQQPQKDQGPEIAGQVPEGQEATTEYTDENTLNENRDNAKQDGEKPLASANKLLDSYTNNPE